MTIVVEYLLANIVALIVQNISEWFVHKHILHEMGKNKKSFFHYHWEHHNRCRKNRNEDYEYFDFWEYGIVSPMIKKELWLMAGMSVAFFLPLYFFVWKMLAFASVSVIWGYFFFHAYSHINVRFGRKYMRHHYDHHMGPDQNQNWCVTFPWFDWIMKTRYRGSLAGVLSQLKKK